MKKYIETKEYNVRSRKVGEKKAVNNLKDLILEGNKINVPFIFKK